VADACASCGAKLGFTRRLTGAQLCADCEAKATRDDATLSAAFQTALADEILTADEEQQLANTARSLGFDQARYSRVVAKFNDQMIVAQVNDGRMPVVSDPPIILKRGETAHLVLAAQLLKEVTEREFRGGSRGVSFRIAPGVRYRVGTFRGHSVVTGSHIEVTDSGSLSITSQRAVYTGQRKTLDMPYAKLEAVNVFTDGIQFHLANRQNPPLLQVPNGPLAAAVINAAAGRVA
jgi:hypothetical protein